MAKLWRWYGEEKIKEGLCQVQPHPVSYPVSYTYKSSAVAEMGDRLATINMGRKIGGCAPFRGSWFPI